MGELSSQEHGSEEPKQSVSVMHSFLDSKEELAFTDEIGMCGLVKNHCEISTTSDFPLKQKVLYKGKKCWISRWEAEPGKAPTFSFRRPFISREKNPHKAPSKVEEQTRAEISIMKNFRHPHVAVFLGTWRRYGSLSILTFPAACSDLGTLMERISDDLEGRLASTSRPGDSSELEYRFAKEVAPFASSSPDVKDPCLQHLLMIQSYFGCLSQALTYLHEQGVWHKDIRPINIKYPR